MKKAIGIIILGLLWCNVGFAKELLIECIGEADGQQFTDNFLIDTSKKTWGNAKSDKSKHDEIHIDDQRFLKLNYMDGDEAWVCDTSNKCTAGYSELNRLTGEYTSAFFDIPRDELQKEWFDKKPIYESKKKYYLRARDYLIQVKHAQYISSYYKAKCSKSDKKF